MMLDDRCTQNRRPAAALPARAGVGFKGLHFAEIIRSRPNIGFFEIHAENLMGAGGPPHAQLSRIRADYALSVHGVGLSIGGGTPLNPRHLERLKTLVDRYEPASFSEHLAWSSHGTSFLNDLLPVAYHMETLERVVSNVQQVQERLNRRILLENPATYLEFETSTFSEIEFLDEIARRTGCGLLLDITNVHVSAVNNYFSAEAYIDAFPMRHVEEIHLAGFSCDSDDLDQPLLIDAHCRPVANEVWALYQRALTRTGPIATLIEWDNDIPSWDVLHAQAQRAEALLTMAKKIKARRFHAVAQ
ncbi:MAG: hypothetical protein CTY15_12455 [Methylocystis sp.]|nr:MAG: hypothetical protein CTY15_12455 [Methylocystis sp.]